jgi:outer membrane lipoprotein SlyB
MRLNSFVSVGSMAVGSGGAAAGFALGTAIFPGIGSIVGAVVGGIAGGFAGEKISAKAYKALEEQIKLSKAKRKQEKKDLHFRQLESTCTISHERFDICLQLL